MQSSYLGHGIMLIIPEEVEIFVPTLTALGMRDQDLIRRFRDTALRELNREIDKLFHPYFEDPDKCLQAVFLDTYAHQAVDPSNMLSGRASEALSNTHSSGWFDAAQNSV